MRIHVQDFSGHPFQVQLSRELARRGHQVTHSYCAQYVSGHGRLIRTDEDPATFDVVSMETRRPLRKYDVLSRLRFEIAYARVWRRYLSEHSFDVVVVCNVPLFALALMCAYFRRRHVTWVMWHQDVYSLGVAQEIRSRLPRIFHGLATWVERLERRQVADADRVIAISNSFVREYERWDISTNHVRVIPNWAPLNEVTPAPRNNDWSRSHRIPEDKFRLVYAGTLGRKHNPLLLMDLLDAVHARGVDATLIVCSEGEGADDILRGANGREDVRVLGFQPIEQFSQVLGSADLVVALLEPDASRFSVPSKVHTYLAAGRPIACLMAGDNPAARDVVSVDGFVGPPNRHGVDWCAHWLENQVAAPERLRWIGQRARSFAEDRFDIGSVTDQFEDVFAAACGREPTHSAIAPPRAVRSRARGAYEPVRD